MSKMTYLEAAVIVLEASDHPLTTYEVLMQIEGRGLVLPSGQTPVRTLRAALYRSLGKHPRLRKQSREGSGRAAWGSVRWYMSDE